MKENEIQKEIKGWLSKQDDVVSVRFNSGAVKIGNRFVRFCDVKGVSDIICSVRGLYVAFEVKNESGRLSEDQVTFLSRVNSIGSYGVCVRDLGDVQFVVEGIRNGQQIQLNKKFEVIHE